MAKGRDSRLRRNPEYKKTGIYRDRIDGTLFMWIIASGDDVTEYVSGWIPICNFYTVYGSVLTGNSFAGSGFDSVKDYEYVCSIEQLGDVLKNKLDLKAREEEIPF